MVVCSILIGDFSMFTKYTADTSSIYYVSPGFNILISSIKEKEKAFQESSLPPAFTYSEYHYVMRRTSSLMIVTQSIGSV